MLPALIVLAVVAVLAAAWALTLNRSARLRQAELAKVTDDLTTTSANLVTAEARVATLENERSAAVTRAEAADLRARSEQQRAAEAETRAKEEWDRAAAADTRASAERTRAEEERARAEQEREVAATERRTAEGERERAAAADAASEAAVARATTAEQELLDIQRTLDPEGLWVFERRRLCRLWRDWVSVHLDATCPLPVRPTMEAARAAVDIVASASREECGVPIDVGWAIPLDTPISIEGVLVLLRAVEELVATARRTNGGELTITRTGEDLDLALIADPGQVLPTDLAASTASLGWQVTVDANIMRVRLAAALASRPTAPQPF